MGINPQTKEYTWKAKLWKAGDSIVVTIPAEFFSTKLGEATLILNNKYWIKISKGA